MMARQDAGLISCASYSLLKSASADFYLKKPVAIVCSPALIVCRKQRNKNLVRFFNGRTYKGE